MGEKDALGREIADVQRKAALRELTAIRKHLEDQETHQFMQELSREQREREEIQAREQQERESAARAACEAFRKASELDPAIRLRLAEGIIAEIDETRLLGKITQAPGSSMNLDGHFLGSKDAGKSFGRAEHQRWGYATLLTDFRFYCVTREDYSPHAVLVMDKTEGQRDDLAKLLDLARTLPLTEASKEKCESLRASWKEQREAKQAELDRIRSELPALRKAFYVKRIVKWGLVTAACLLGLLCLFYWNQSANPVRKSDQHLEVERRIASMERKSNTQAGRQIKDRLPSSPTPTLQELIGRLRAEGQRIPVHEVEARLLGLSPKSDSLSFSAPESQTADHQGRTVRLVLEADKPVALVWTVMSDSGGNVRLEYYRTSLEGSLLRAVRAGGQMDSTGKPADGSGAITELDPSRSEVIERFRKMAMAHWLESSR